jgi:hypothetical protein
LTARARLELAAKVSSQSPGRSRRGCERGEEARRLNRGARPDVVDADWRVRVRWVGIGRVPVGVGQGDPVGGADPPLDNVVDEGEVAAVLAGLLSQIGRPARIASEKSIGTTSGCPESRRR